MIFDVISCYYPIDFQPPEDEKITVTPNELKAGLNNCLKANSKLAPRIIPLLFEKFNSGLLESRLQSMETLKQCILGYGVGAMEQIGSRIWNEMKNEIYNGVNIDLRERCLEVISAMFWVLTLPNVKSKDLDPVSILLTIRDFAEEKLSYSEEKYFKPAVQIYVAVVKSSGTLLLNCLKFLMLSSMANFGQLFISMVRRLFARKFTTLHLLSYS